MGRKPEGTGSGRAPPNTVGVYGHLIRIEMAASFTLSQPQAVEKLAYSSEGLRLSCLDLRTRPIDSVDLGFSRCQCSKVFVFGRIREFCIQTVPFDILRDLVIPGASLLRRKRVANDARTAIFDFRDHLRRNRV